MSFSPGMVLSLDNNIGAIGDILDDLLVLLYNIQSSSMCLLRHPVALGACCKNQSAAAFFRGSVC